MLWKRWICLTCLSFAPILRAQVSPTIGFHIIEIPASGQSLLANPFTTRPVVTTAISAIDGKKITLATTPTSPITPKAAFIEVISGTHQGLTLRVIGVEGLELTLERTVEDLISPGDCCHVNQERTLENVFMFMSQDPQYTILSGQDPESSDLITLLDPLSENSERVFYLKAGQGWYEVGMEHLGDQGDTAMPYHQGFFYKRRNPESLQISFSGRLNHIPQRIIPVQHGRNIIAHFGLLQNSELEHYFTSEGPFRMISGNSIADSDSVSLTNGLKFTNRYYFSATDGWRPVGTPIATNENLLTIAADFFRAGPDGLIITSPIGLPPAAMQLSSTTNQTTDEVIDADFELDLLNRTITFNWKASALSTYIVQHRERQQDSWADAEVILTTSSSTEEEHKLPLQQETSGYFRVLKRTDITHE